MAGICGVHRNKVEGCRMCESTPWELLDVTKEQYENSVANAASEGLMECPKCHFNQMYKKGCRQKDGKYRCPRCGNLFVE